MEAQTDEVLKESLEEQITDLRYDLEYHTRNTIAWMIADGLLEIRFAVPKKNLSGDFHDKFGIIEDMVGNTVAFHGSQNDSESALSNYEAYTIDCDWLSDRDAEGVRHQQKRFERLWQGEFENVEIYSIPEAAKEKIAKPEMTTIGLTHRPKRKTTELLCDRINRKRLKFGKRTANGAYLRWRRVRVKRLPHSLQPRQRSIVLSHLS